MKSKNNKMSEITLDAMRRIYASDENYGVELDWMGYEMDEEDNWATYHHIVSETNGGSDDIDNGAILGYRSCQMLHQIEKIDKDLYDSWNEVFLIINKMGTYPIPEVWSMIMNLQVQSEQVLKEQTKTFQKTIARR